MESLQYSVWSSVTFLVPGEADEYCAIYARASKTAILSNDSDLLLYDVGAEGMVTILRTIESVDSFTENNKVRLKAQCLRLSEVSRQLVVPDLTTFGYYRSIDSSASTAVIAQRARESHGLDDDASWKQFQTGYNIDAIDNLHDHPQDCRCIQCLLQELDPRTSELVISVIQSGTCHMYLTPVLEDPTRDSAWSYGSELRQLAYSLLFYHAEEGPESGGRDHVVEHSRKGPRIAEHHVQILPVATMLKRLPEIYAQLSHYASHDSMVKKEGTFTTGDPQAVHSSPQTTTKIILEYYMFATEITIAERLSKSKSYQPSLSRIFPTSSRTCNTIPTYNWDDIHLLASIQCVLYSLRILKQCLAWLSCGQPLEINTIIAPSWIPLIRHLENMPKIAELFLDIPSLHGLLAQLPFGVVAKNIEQVLLRVDPGSLRSVHTGNSVSRDLVNDQSGKEGDRAKDTWHEASSRQTKRKIHEKGRESQRKLERGGAGSSAGKRGSSGGNNIFALLQEDEESSDRDGE